MIRKNEGLSSKDPFVSRRRVLVYRDRALCNPSWHRQPKSRIFPRRWHLVTSEIFKVFATERVASPFPVWSKPIYSSYQKQKTKKQNTKEKRDRAQGRLGKNKGRVRLYFT